jgi:hypothetical protein
MIATSMGLYKAPYQRTYQAIRDPRAGARQRATEIINSTIMFGGGDLNLDIAMSPD